MVTWIKRFTQIHFTLVTRSSTWEFKFRGLHNRQLLCRKDSIDSKRKTTGKLKTTLQKRVSSSSHQLQRCPKWTCGYITPHKSFCKVEQLIWMANHSKARKRLNQRNLLLVKSKKTHGSQGLNLFLTMPKQEAELQLGFWDLMASMIIIRMPRVEIIIATTELLLLDLCGGQEFMSSTTSKRPKRSTAAMAKNMKLRPIIQSAHQRWWTKDAREKLLMSPILLNHG